MIESALVAMLKADADVIAIVGTRVYPAPAPGIGHPTEPDLAANHRHADACG